MPNYDPNGNEWPLEMCKVKEAWELTLPPHGEGKNKGESIAIVHPDTGWTNHPELLNGRYLTGIHSKNFLDSNFLNPNPSAEDKLEFLGIRHPSHGTTTASLMFSDEGHPKNNPSNVNFPDYTVPLNKFVTGIAPKSYVLPLRVINSVLLSTSQSYSTPVVSKNTYSTLADSIYFALGLNNLQYGVISMSVGGIRSPRNLEMALKTARQKGFISVAAGGQFAGNMVLKDPIFPGTSIHTIATAGCDKNFNAPSEAFYGPEIEVTAPGWGLTVSRSHILSPNFRIDDNSDGTSYSTALIAGACALWQAYHGRSQLIKKYGRPLLLDVFRICLANSSEIPDGQTGFNKTGGVVGNAQFEYDNRGNGVLNAEELLKYSLPTFEKAKEVAEYNQWKEENWGDPSDWGRE
ncbi:Subtilase family protein [Salegentibacter holothuriorum]|uniref:Subtilase family protein n=1 Tax=Salegentibacter holothuriorum TaxID=241145 RepID=A0A1T5AY12_9FLAO|nr:S8 family serine peptidase [Salegentibacter holothuriorum]SKB39513.1 Subtilase family protein [Salegentibacter holothuriorum]